MTVTPESAEAIQRLCQPFDVKDVKFKPQVVQGNRALAICYVDARAIQDRLDYVVGVEGWQDEYEVLPDNSVVCRLRLKLGGEWVTKMDVGGPSEQPDGGDRMKAAFSDALKRAAVKFGVGRYLYRLPQIWHDYDPTKRQFKTPPALPAFALPRRSAPVGTTPAALPATEPKAEPETKPGRRLPANGQELLQRLRDYEAKLVAEGLCREGSLVTFVAEEGQQAGFAYDVATWTTDGMTLAAKLTRRFEKKVRDDAEQQQSADRRREEPAKADTLHRLGQIIARHDKVKTWKAALNLAKVWPKDRWTEPRSDDEVLAISEILTEDQAGRLVARLSPSRQTANR